VKFLFELARVGVNCVQVRGVLYPNIAAVKLVFKLCCYTITVPWVFSWYGPAKVLWRKNSFVCFLKYPVI